jgi:hypothetical protein
MSNCDSLSDEGDLDPREALSTGVSTISLYVFHKAEKDDRGRDAG